jgi:hypothetical protein
LADPSKVELVPGGHNLEVTEENKAFFFQLKAPYGKLRS